MCNQYLTSTTVTSEEGLSACNVFRTDCWAWCFVSGAFSLFQAKIYNSRPLFQYITVIFCTLVVFFSIFPHKIKHHYSRFKVHFSACNLPMLFFNISSLNSKITWYDPNLVPITLHWSKWPFHTWSTKINPAVQQMSGGWEQHIICDNQNITYKWNHQWPACQGNFCIMCTGSVCSFCWDFFFRSVLFPTVCCQTHLCCSTVSLPMLRVVEAPRLIPK